MATADADTPHRLIEVPAARLPGWVERFEQRHGPGVVEAARDGIRLRAPDGAIALLLHPFPPSSTTAADAPATIEHLLACTAAARDTVLLLIRRGGFAVGVTHEARLISHKVGTRYVQGRTAAGGWSQQRFARRRSGQTADLARAATEALVAQPWQQARSLTCGGDQSLIAAVLADPRLSRVKALPRGRHLDVGDPRLRTLQECADRATHLQIKLNDAAR